MNDFIVTARKWRPLFFKDVVGQDHITQTLKNAVLKHRIHHAYLFSGPRGVGKTTTARILSRSINCLNPQDAEPCNDCDNCRAVMDGRSMDVIEIDGASNNSVDDIRKLRENAKYPPSTGKYKMYIIDEVHMLSNAAFNALLKTLEEPPPHLLFVFATTEVHKVLPTITSRCQRFDFRRMEIEDITKQLAYIAEKEGINMDEESLVTIAKKGDGSMRDSQSIFDQVISFCGKNVVYSELTDALHLIDEEFFFSITNAVKDKNTAEIFDLVGKVVRKGYDFQETLQGLLEHLRNLTAVKVTGNPEILETSSQMKTKYLEESGKFSKLDLIRMMNHIAQAEQSLKFTPQPRIRFELALLQLAHIDSTTDISELLIELREVKKNGFQVTEHTNGNKPVTSLPLIHNHNITIKAPVLKEVSVISKRKLSASEFVNEWSSFIERDDIIKAGFRLNSFSPELKGRTIKLYCESDFESGYLERKKENLALMVESMYDLYVNFEIEVKPVNHQSINLSHPAISSNNLNIVTPSHIKTKSNIADPNLHPVERLLIENFGAELLMDFSKER